MKKINKILYITNNKAKLFLDDFKSKYANSSKQYFELFINDILIIDFYSAIKNQFYIYSHISNRDYKTLVCSFDRKIILEEYRAVFNSIRNLINEANK